MSGKVALLSCEAQEVGQGFYNHPEAVDFLPFNRDSRTGCAARHVKVVLWHGPLGLNCPDRIIRAFLVRRLLSKRRKAATWHHGG